MAITLPLDASAPPPARVVSIGAEATEGALIEACLTGDERARRIFYERHYRMVLGVALRYAVDEPQARDYLNRTFLTAFKRLDQFRGEGAVAAWLRTICVNVCLGQLRIRRNQSYAELPDAGKEKSAPPRALQELAAEDLIALIQQLPPVPRAVFNLTAVEGMSHKQAGLRLGITETTSRYHLRQARLRLQAAVTKLNQR